MSGAVPPRLYGIVAQRAPVAVMLMRRPSKWFHVMRWRLDTGELERGAWLRARIYPRRCDLSPDGEFLLYYAANWAQSHQWPSVYVGLSRAPWLFALAAWNEHYCTYGGGYAFTEPPPEERCGVRGFFIAHGDVSRLPFDMRPYDTHRFAVELHHGWREPGVRVSGDGDGSPDAEPDVHLVRSQPGGGLELGCLHRGWVSRADRDRPEHRYELRDEAGGLLDLLDAQWADWGHDGALLRATCDGRLVMERCEPDGAGGVRRKVVREHDLRGTKPEPTIAPEWARVL